MIFYLLGSGFAGTPFPYSLCRDDAVVLILLACFFLSSMVLFRGKKLLFQQLKDFVLHRGRTSIFDVSTAINARYFMVLTIQTCVLAAILLFNFFYVASPGLTDRIPPLPVLGIYAAFCLAYFLLKWGLYTFLGWIFLDKEEIGLCVESYFTLVYCFGFLLFPIVLFLIYFNPGIAILVLTSIIVLVLMKILMFYKWLKFFFHRFATIFPIILYFCALEIIPCLLFYRGMVRVNDLLLIKF